MVRTIQLGTEWLIGQLEPQWPGLLVAMARLDLGLPLRVPTSNASCLNNEIYKDYNFIQEAIGFTHGIQ